MAKVSHNKDSAPTRVIPRRFSSSFFHHLPSGISNTSSVAKDHKNENTNASCEANRSVGKKDKTAATKRKLARVSLDKIEIVDDGMNMTNEGNQPGSSLSSSDSDNDSEDEQIRKKQKTGLETQEEGLEEENSGRGGNNDALERYNENDGLIGAYERAPAVVPTYLEDDSESPYSDSIRKLKQWTNELLSITKEIEDARLENAVLMNNLYKLGVKRDEFA